MTLSQAALAADEDHPFYILGPDVDHVGWTPGLTPTAIEAEIEDVSTMRKGYFEIPGVSRPFDYTYDRLDDLYNALGLRIGTAYTMLFQGLSGGPWDQFGGAGDFDLMGSWTLVGKDTENTGRVIFDLEERFKIGERTPNSLGSQIATLVATANTFNDRGLALRDLHWEQRLWDGQFRFMFGRADSTAYFGSTWMQSANNSFVNRMFAANPTVAAPGHGPAAGISFKPNDQDFYITAGAANAFSSTTRVNIDSLVDEWTFFSYGELGWTPKFEGLGEGRYTFSGWHAGERESLGQPADWGVTAIADQQFNDVVEAFARWGYAGKADLGIRNYIQGGVGFRLGLAGREANDTVGAAFSWAFPSNSELRQEKVCETFYRLQLTRFSQFSVGAQAIFDPSDAPGTDVVGAFWGRLRIYF